jgi:lipopolysaccharide export system protein LptA
MVLKPLSINRTSAFLAFLLTISLSAPLYYAGADERKTRGAVTITSEKLTADNKAGTALFEQSVIAKTGEMTLHAERMLVSYSRNSGNVTRIDAEGNVRFLRGSRLITSKTASYFSADEKVVFSGEPRAVEGENVVTGSKMTYFVNDDRFLVDNSKVFLSTGKKDRP